MSWKVEVVADKSGKWTGNGLRFASKEDALAYGKDLQSRWVLVEKYRAVESTDPVNAAFDAATGKYHYAKEPGT